MLLNQQKYILDILQDAGLQNAKIMSYPILKGVKLDNDYGNILTDPNKYRRLIERLLCLGLTRPNMSYSTQQLSQLI